MWVSRSFDSLGSRARAIFGKLRGAIANGNDDEYDDGTLAIEAPRGLDRDDFETVRIDDSGSSAEIYVAKPSEAAYFEIENDYAPTIVGVSKVDARVDDIVEPRSRREKAAAGEPADLFINALRRPVREKFDASTPVFKKKVEAEPITAPATEVEPVVEQIVFDAVDVAEQSEVVVATEVAAEEVETVIDETILEAPAVEAEPDAEEPVTESLEIPVINIPAPVAEEPVVEAVEETPAVEAEPVVAEEVPEAEPVIEVAPVAEPIMALPAPAAPVEAAVAEEEYDFSMFDNLESDDARVEYEIRHDVGKEEEFEILADELVVEAVEETPAVEAEPAVAEENLEIPVINIPAEAPIAEAAAEESVVEAVEETPAVEAEPAVADEPVVEAEPVRALPTRVVLSLPQKIEIPELERAEPQEDSFSGYSCGEMAETSAAVEESKVSDTNTVGEIKEQLPPVIVNEDRDVLFAFRDELESDEFEFINTSYDDNLAFREDYLDETERTFKIRAKIERPRFNGDLRSLACY